MKALNRYGTPFLLGVVAGLGLLLPILWWVTFLALAVWFVSFDSMFTKKQALVYGWSFGFGKALVAISWFWSAYPVDWMGFPPGVLQIFILSLYWVPVSFSMGVGIGLFALWYQWLLTNIKNKYRLVILAAIMWVFGEVLGAYGFSIFTFGPGGSVNAGFSYGATGYVLSNHALLFELAAYGGLYLLTLTVALIVLAGVWLLPKSSHRIAVIIFLLFSSFTTLPSSQYEPVGESVAMIEAYFPASDSLSVAGIRRRETESFSLVKEALESEATTIVLPEDFRFTTYFEQPEDVLHYIGNITDREVVLIDSARTDLPDGGVVLRAYVYETKKQAIYIFDKNYLVPQGEFVPYVYGALIKTFLGKQEFAGWIQQETRYEPGIDQRSLDLPDTVPPVLFCFESSLPYEAAAITREKSTFIAHPVAHSWFQNHQSLLWVQQEAMLRIQASYTGLPIMQAANEAQAKVYLPDGAVYTAGASYDGESKVFVFEI